MPALAREVAEHQLGATTLDTKLAHSKRAIANLEARHGEVEPFRRVLRSIKKELARDFEEFEAEEKCELSTDVRLACFKVYLTRLPFEHRQQFEKELCYLLK
jgi:hypothetical protein